MYALCNFRLSCDFAANIIMEMSRPYPNRSAKIPGREERIRHVNSQQSRSIWSEI